MKLEEATSKESSYQPKNSAVVGVEPTARTLCHGNLRLLHLRATRAIGCRWRTEEKKTGAATRSTVSFCFCANHIGFGLHHWWYLDIIYRQDSRIFDEFWWDWWAMYRYPKTSTWGGGVPHQRAPSWDLPTRRNGEGQQQKGARRSKRLVEWGLKLTSWTCAARLGQFLRILSGELL